MLQFFRIGATLVCGKTNVLKTAFQRANHIWKQALEEYQQATLEGSRLEALESFVSKRKENLGIPNH